MTRPSTASDLHEQADQIATDAPLVKPHETLAAALVAALHDLTVVERGRTANAGSYSYDYADIADVVKLTRPRLAVHGIVALTPIVAHGDGLACTVTLLHTSGDRLDLGPFPFPHGRDAQATGSMVTYHRRYALVAALGIAAGDDDDGASAQARQPVERPWNQKQAKDQVLACADGNTELAAKAWQAFGTSTPWTADALKAAFEVWVNEPAEPPTPSETVEEGT